MSTDPAYGIHRDVHGSYLAWSHEGRASLLVPVTDARPPLDRAAGDVVLTFRPRVRFDTPGTSFESNAAIVECANDSLGDTFRVLAHDVARRLDARMTRPTPQEVSTALSRWEELLRARRQLSREDEVGLWGELWTLLALPDVEKGVAVWRGPDAEYVDFVGGGVGIECKAAFRRLQHFVSQEQVTRPLGDVRVYLQSLWVDHDAVAGETVNDLVARVGDALSDPREFEEKLLGTGYSRGDAHRYKLRLRVLEPPLLFPADAVPRVRAADAGVSHIRFLASLQEGAALSPPLALETTLTLCDGS